MKKKFLKNLLSFILQVDAKSVSELGRSYVFGMHRSLLDIENVFSIYIFRRDLPRLVCSERQ